MARPIEPEADLRLTEGNFWRRQPGVLASRRAAEARAEARVID